MKPINPEGGYLFAVRGEESVKVAVKVGQSSEEGKMFIALYWNVNGVPTVIAQFDVSMEDPLKRFCY